MSPFYDTRWQAWDIEDKGTGLGIFGMGSTTFNSIHYQTQPLGQNTLVKGGKHHTDLEADASWPVTKMWNVSSYCDTDETSFPFVILSSYLPAFLYVFPCPRTFHSPVFYPLLYRRTMHLAPTSGRSMA